ncbi:MAG: hypothetical protein HKP41_16915 [Desulfobacterales bacterium]|nr:hypothetical protein [Desulfobacterales bacterium]
MNRLSACNIDGLANKITTQSWWIAAVVILLTSCAPQISSEISHNQITLTGNDLRNGGIAFVTPSTVTGQEEEKQAVAFIFASTLIEQRPDLRIIPLPNTLSLINKAELADEYKEMYKEYRDTGIFSKATLGKIAEAGGIRYVAQLKLAGFTQRSRNRFGVFGLRMIQTNSATVRIFFQLWDSSNGAISWESVAELSWAEEKILEDPVTLQTIMVRAAKDIAENLPR